MKLESRKLRACLSIKCEYLDNGECTVEQCGHPDIGEAVKERIAQLAEVKNGR